MNADTNKPAPIAEPACTWREPDRTGMRYPEQSDLSGGATDCAPAPAVDERTNTGEFEPFFREDGTTFIDDLLKEDLASASDGSPGGAAYEVRVAGPDDLHRFDDELSALRFANEINKAYLADLLAHPNDEVLCVATVHPQAGAQG